MQINHERGGIELPSGKSPQPPLIRSNDVPRVRRMLQAVHEREGSLPLKETTETSYAIQYDTTSTDGPWFGETCTHCDADPPALVFIEYVPTATTAEYCDQCLTLFLKELEAYVKRNADVLLTDAL